jgi:hypothetical protein
MRTTIALLAAVLLGAALPASALIQGSSTASNCGEGGNWIDITFTTDEGVTLVDAWWDFNGTGVWLDADGTSMCSPQNNGVTDYDFYFDVPAGTNTQDFGLTATGFDGGDYFRFTMDLDMGLSGMPYGADYMGGTVTVEFSDATVLVATFDTAYDGSNGATASFTNLGALPNLAFETKAGWAGSLVPRSANDATWTSVPAPAFLVGEADSTWLNAVCRNTGTVLAGASRMTFHLDGAAIGYRNLWTIDPGLWNGPINYGTFNVRGGRHMLRVTADALDAVMESDETDNVLSVQYCWQGDYLPPLNNWTRAAPPLNDLDWEYGGGGSWWNCDGVRIVPEPGFDWTAVWCEREADTGHNYQVRLHPASDDPENAFGTNFEISRGGAGLQVVLVNTQTYGSGPWDAGVLNFEDYTDDYRIGHMYESPYPFDFGIEPTTPYFATRMMMFQFHVGPGDLGPATLTAYTNPAHGPVRMGWLAPDFTHGNLDDLNGEVVTDAEGLARIDLDLTVTGDHCAVVYANRAEHPGGLAVNVGLYHGMPDLRPTTMTGWHAPIVPRPAPDTALFSVPLPDTLHGNLPQTYMNFAGINGGLAAATERSFAIEIDGASDYGMWNTETWSVGQVKSYRDMERGAEPWTVEGGRHTLCLRADFRETVDECVERNNDTARQYCWSPLVLPTNATVNRGGYPLPDREGGWDSCPTGTTLYWNCDGLRMPYIPPIGGNRWWSAVAVMPPTLALDIDLQLHQALDGTQDGFGPNVLAESFSGDGLIDFVLVNDRFADNQAHDVGVLDDLDDYVSSYQAQEARSSWVGLAGPGEIGPFAMGTGRMLNLHEFLLDPGYHLITLKDNGTGVDWGMSLYQDGTYHGKADVVADALANDEGDGVTERMVVDVPAGTSCCLAVWKADAGEIVKDGSYSLWVAEGVSGVDVPAAAPSANRLVSAAPNPFNPRTTITFALAQDGPCELALFDLQGRRVRTLVSGHRAAGTLTEVWDGEDDRGRRAASGVYLARLQAGGVQDLLKVTLVK